MKKGRRKGRKDGKAERVKEGGGKKGNDRRWEGWMKGRRKEGRREGRDGGKEEGEDKEGMDELKEVKEVQSCVPWVKCTLTPLKPTKIRFNNFRSVSRIILYSCQSINPKQTTAGRFLLLS